MTDPSRRVFLTRMAAGSAALALSTSALSACG